MVQKAGKEPVRQHGILVNAPKKCKPAEPRTKLMHAMFARPRADFPAPSTCRPTTCRCPLEQIRHQIRVLRLTVVGPDGTGGSRRKLPTLKVLEYGIWITRLGQRTGVRIDSR